MSNPEGDIVFTGAIPKLYEMYLVPLIFQPYATEPEKRLTGRKLSRVLEVAAGTGVVTRALASALPESVGLVATDLSEGMLEQAESIGTARPVEWRQADALALPFPNESFDAVLCQFGVMFSPTKQRRFRKRTGSSGPAVS